MAAPLVVLAAHFIALAVAQEQTDKGWELRVTNMKEQSRICFDASKLPESAKGMYFIAGPSKFDGHPKGQWEYQAIFDGIGMANRFEIHPTDQPGKLCYTNVWMNTGVYQNFVKDPTQPPRGVLFQDTMPSRSAFRNCTLYMCDYNAPNDNNWVNPVPIGKELIWFSDTPTMVRMDPSTLNCTGKKTWTDDKKSFTGLVQPSWVQGGHMASGGSAHPVVLPGTETVVELLTESPMLLGSNYLDVYTFDASVTADQSRKLVARIKEDSPMYLHSFGVTPNHVILPFNLMNGGIGPGRLPLIINNFSPKWKGVHVLNIHDGSVKVFDDMDPFMHVHTSNCYENASGIVMDVGAYEGMPFSVGTGAINIKFSLNKTLRDSKDLRLRSTVRRFHLNNVTGKTTAEQLTEPGQDYDFFKINTAYTGLPHCIYYAVEWFHDRKSYASMAIMKHDVCKGKKVWWNRPNVYVNEPWFIPSSPGSAEDEGTLIFTANDGNAGTAIFVALDAQTFTELQTITLPTHLPFLAHGHFLQTSADTLLV
jgi:beta,beta-carotene 9',10'-dioxygenase